MCARASACQCVCVCENERERETEDRFFEIRLRNNWHIPSIYIAMGELICTRTVQNTYKIVQDLAGNREKERQHVTNERRI